MDVVRININELIPYENNPRCNDSAIDYVADSISKFDFRNPILIDKNNVVVAGHTRLSALKKLGRKEADCVRIEDLSDDEIRAFRIADNSTADFAKWDYDKLKSELDAINISDSENELLEDMIAESNDSDSDDEYPVLPLENEYDKISFLQKHNIKIGSIFINLTDEEYEELVERYNEFALTGQSVGFINYLLDGGNSDE